jgi:hypothetical protein
MATQKVRYGHRYIAYPAEFALTISAAAAFLGIIEF